ERRLLTAIEKATRQPLTQMQLPSVEDVNVTRLARFDDAITEALAHPERIEMFRDIVGHYVSHHDVPEADVAAALAVVAQGDTPLLLSPEEARAQRFDREDRDRSDRPERSNDRGGDRGGSGERPERRARNTDRNMSSYRIEVGKRHKVEPRQIVGALANEGGLSREDFGAIKILPDFSIVDLPANLPQEVFDKLEQTRISGKLIEIRPDKGRPGGRPDDRGGDRGPRKPRREY
ncbi:MAG: ATP-dependent helicase, partial [Glaciihabitans sp.]|nr:ATP-dependent helicase [Glaciihabitans sp.]